MGLFRERDVSGEFFGENHLLAGDEEDEEMGVVFLEDMLELVEAEGLALEFVEHVERILGVLGGVALVVLPHVLRLEIPVAVGDINPLVFLEVRLVEEIPDTLVVKACEGLPQAVVLLQIGFGLFLEFLFLPVLEAEFGFGFLHLHAGQLAEGEDSELLLQLGEEHHEGGEDE